MVVRTLAVGTGVFLCFLTVLRPPSGSGLLVPVAPLLHWGSLPSRWGHPCGVEVCLSSIVTKV